MISVIGSPSIEIAQWVGPPLILPMGVASQRIQVQKLKFYRIWSSVDAFFLVGESTVVATTSSHPLTAKLSELLTTGNGCNWIAAVVAAGTGTLFISELDPVP